MLDSLYRWYDRIMTRLDPYLSDIMMVFLGIAMIFYGSLAFYSYSNETTESMLGLMLTGS